MARPPSRHPTARELEILKLLWDAGPSTVRRVRDALRDSGAADPAYTSVMTVMTTMTKKGYLERQRRGNVYVYEARIKRSATTGSMLHDLIARAFGGATASVALGLLKDADLDANQLRELRQLIDQNARNEEP